MVALQRQTFREKACHPARSLSSCAQDDKLRAG